MESNGSTSMASVCGGILALMDAGVPIKRPVAGISVGLVTEFNGEQLARYTTLTDILGSEDHFGDMDFKLCGTEVGVTGFQLDLKLAGVSHKILSEAIHEAKAARGKILEVMLGAIAAPRTELSKYAPRIETSKSQWTRSASSSGLVARPSRASLPRPAPRSTSTTTAPCTSTRTTARALARAKQIIAGMTKEIEVGETYQGTVVSIKEFGCFVEVMPGKDGLCHVSELADFRVNRVEDVVKMGDTIWVKCIGIDDKGRVKLSRKAAMKERNEVAQGVPANA